MKEGYLIHLERSLDKMMLLTITAYDSFTNFDLPFFFSQEFFGFFIRGKSMHFYFNGYF